MISTGDFGLGSSAMTTRLGFGIPKREHGLGLFRSRVAAMPPAKKRTRLCFDVLGSVRLSIEKPLALCARQQQGGALCIVHIAGCWPENRTRRGNDEGEPH